ncbi:MAG: ADP-ribosylglycohydrolase family protein [Phycisphaerales bacterium]
MLGAIAGDVIGSVHEYTATKTKDFPLFVEHSRFTDDSVMTIAVALSILTGQPYERGLRTLGRAFPHAGYGSMFVRWLHTDDPRPYGSWGNGSAMRVSPVGCAFDDEADVLDHARRSAEVSHDHPEGIKGAQATALAISLARRGASKEAIRSRVTNDFGYDLSRTVDEIRPVYEFDESCMRTVPEAIIAFLDSTSFEDAIRNAISLGGDADTLAAITGAIAEAYYGGVPEEIAAEVHRRLDPELAEIVTAFRQRYG